MKYRIRFTIEYEDATEFDGTYEEAEQFAESRRQYLEDTMNILGVIDPDKVVTLSYVEEMKSKGGAEPSKRVVF